MYSNETMHLPSGRTVIVAAICFVLLSTTFAQGAVEANTSVLRHLKGRTIVSEKSPKVQLTIGRGFLFVGKQRLGPDLRFILVPSETRTLLNRASEALPPQIE